ncbi:hypothetical protein [Neorhodopirellula pilleata]|uniref:Uncharacterized protein n=1 Tax=Neorhodopirellula pilleata TaxID=2714738 RepID=A0A5C6AWB9_9BACT|nr:hypothetical protein [Neorhodopirellula pilleata]TWU03797.1 hypothetical protein Pla100_07270 [Neorhodopirellula pilleata]
MAIRESFHQASEIASKWFLAGALLTFGMLTIGCQPAPDTAAIGTTADEHDHDHEHGHDHDHAHGDEHSDDLDIGALKPIEPAPTPESFDAGVDQLASLRDTVAKGFADKDIDSIHGELHSVGNLLESIETLAQSSEMTDDQKKEAATAIEKLFDAYGSVDEKLHGGEGKDYSEVQKEINSAIATLSNLTKTETK